MFSLEKIKNALTERNKNLVKFFVFFFVVSLVVVNWDDISWIFNYKFLLEGASSVLPDRSEVSAKNILERYIPVEPSNSPEPTLIPDLSFEYSEKENSIEIPKISVEAPIIFVDKNDNKAYHDSLEKGVLHYPLSAFPGEVGTTIILGHSSSPNWPKVNYDWVFGRLNELSANDEIFIIYNHRKYIYQVIETKIISKGDDVPSEANDPGSTLYLLSCWPPGRDLNRIIVKATLISGK